MKLLSRLSVCTLISLILWSCVPMDPENPGYKPVETPDNSEDEDPANDQETPVITKLRKLSGTLEVIHSFSAKASSASSSFYVAMPCPVSNDYQEISNLETDGQSRVTDKGDAYLTWNQACEKGSMVNLISKIQFDYVTYSVSVDFSRISEIFPYDEESEIYRNYTSASGSYIDPSNPKIITIASSLWEKSSNVVDYARKCYEYVASNYKYLNANTGIHSLEKNLQNGGGDCGNLSAIYISLLRAKGIPSRPVVCIRPDGTFHVWSEFYLESYGWIPEDVTYKNSNPQGDYFGKYPGDCVVVSNEYDIPLTIGDKNFDIAILQTYVYWYWNMSGVRSIYSIRPVK